MAPGNEAKGRRWVAANSAAWGIALLLFLAWWVYVPNGLLGKADALGYAVCHRIDLRSFHLGDRALPLCARCTGMYLGGVAGLAFQALTARKRGGVPPWGTIAVLALFALAFAADGLNSFASLIPGLPTLYQPQNWSRLLTGTGMGLTMAAALFPAFNQTVWADWDERPALPGWASLGAMLLIGLAIAALVLTEQPLALYPLALISAAGILLLLTLIYSMVWVMIFRAENRFTTWKGLLLPLAGGFFLAVAQVFVLDALRYLLTGTWEGFHIGWISKLFTV